MILEINMNFLRYTTAAALAILALPANAGTGSGLVRHILVTPKGIVTFTLDSHENAPACSTIKNDFAFDGSTSEGKAKLALLLAAANGKKAVSITGDGTCTAYPDRETPLWLDVQF